MTAAYRWRGLDDAQLEELRAEERKVPVSELKRRAKIAATKTGQPAWNRGHSSPRAAGEEPTNPRDDCGSPHRGLA